MSIQFTWFVGVIWEFTTISFFSFYFILYFFNNFSTISFLTLDLQFTKSSAKETWQKNHPNTTLLFRYFRKMEMEWCVHLPLCSICLGLVGYVCVKGNTNQWKTSVSLRIIRFPLIIVYLLDHSSKFHFIIKTSRRQDLNYLVDINY